MISNVSAEFYKRNSPIDVRHSVRTNEATTSTALCNITIFNPNSQLLVNFQRMSFQSSSQTYNYTLPSSNTSVIGQYKYDITCADAGYNQTEQFTFDINPNGREYTTAESLTYIIMFFVSIFFFGLFTYYATIIKWENIRDSEGILVQINYKKNLKLLFIGLAYITFMWISYMAYNISLGFLQLDGMADLFYLVFKFMIALAWPITIVFSLIFFITYVQDLQLNKKLQRGLTIK